MKLLHPALLLSIALIVLGGSVAAQPKRVSCPSLELTVPAHAVTEGELVTLQASLTGKSSNTKVNYQWTISTGEIVSGQGTNAIQIKTDNLGGAYITAMVETQHATCAARKVESFAIKPGCPNFKLETPPAPVEEGQLAILTANVSGSGAQRVTFHWMVSAGKIRRGQATAAIEVDTSKLGGVGILAAVELGGLAPACRTSEVVAVMIAKKPGKKAKVRAMVDQ